MFFTYSQAFYDLRNKLQPLYDEREAATLAHEILQFVTGLDKTQRLIHKDKHFTAMQQETYQHAAYELLSGRPLQYITGSAWFMGKEFYVNQSVLIPRPETEELVQWIVDENSGSPVRILDIGTGSGCIPIFLKLKIQEAIVTSCDISSDAIEVAKQNADILRADVQFLQVDFLDVLQHNKLGMYHVIVSNPPYIPVGEMEKLHTNVKDHEPHLALFVPNEDALVFYKAIALFGRAHLNSNGYIYCELDAGHAQECKTVFEDAGYKDVLIKKDMNDNWRMLRAGKYSK